jgi:hypothetical protein
MTDQSQACDNTIRKNASQTIETGTLFCIVMYCCMAYKKIKYTEEKQGDSRGSESRVSPAVMFTKKKVKRIA